MRHTRTVSFYVMREVALYTLVGLVAVSFIFIGHNLVRRMTDFLRIGVTAADVFTIVRSVVVVTLAYTVPISFLFGSLVAVARLSSDSEIVAMRACGVGLRDIVLPIFAMGVVVSCFTWYIALEVEHRAKRVLREVVWSVTASGQMIESGRFRQLGDRMIYVEHRGRDNQLEGVFIADHSDPSRRLLIFAESGRLSFDAETQRVHVLLHDGDLHSEAEDGSEGSDYRMSFESFEYVFRLRMPQELDFRILRPRDMTMAELRKIVARARAGKSIGHLLIDEVEKYEVQIHRRYALPVAPMIFGLLAVPISLGRARGARAWGALLCALLVGAYYGGLSFTQYLAAHGVVPAALALWTPNVLFAGLAIGLLWRARRVPA